MIVLILAIVVALILFSVLRVVAVPVMMMAGLAYMFGSQVAAYAFLPIVILTVIGSWKLNLR